MAKYSDIKGFTVQTVSTDPAASGISAASWASGENMNRGNNIEAQGSGTSGSAIIAVGGQIAPSTTANNAEKYDGTNWTEVNDLNAARNNAAASSNSPYDSSLYFGGTPPGTGVTNTESWNGSSWTEVSELNLARGSNAGAGTSNTAALCFTGESPEGGASGPHTDSNELWDGSSWSEEADLSQGRREAGGTGTSTAALCIGGSEDPPANINKVEQWNGSSWTEISEINTARNENASSGTVTSALTFGGRTPSKTANTEHWNGSSWTEVNNLSTARSDSYAGGGTAGSTIMSGGETSTAYTNITEEFTAPTVFAQTIEGQLYFNSTTNTFKETILDIPPTSWSSGNNLNTARGFLTGAGTQTDALAISGYKGPPGPSNDVENYNGTSWTEIAEVNVVRLEGAAFGSDTAANFVGGNAPTAPGRVASNESWNGSSWTEVTDMPAATDNLCQGAGTATAGMVVGGQTAPGAGNKTTNNVFYDGTNWTAASSLNAAKTLHAVMGNQVSAMAASGLTGSPTASTVNTEKWDGTTWTEVANVNQARYRVIGAGTGDSAIVFGGTNYPSTTLYALTEAWNGTSWTEISDMATAREAGSTTAGSGSSAGSTLFAGGSLGTPVTNVTEEWTSSLSNKTITVS